MRACIIVQTDCSIGSSAERHYSEYIVGSHEICMEQSVLNTERVFARLEICPGLFEQLGPIQQYHKLCRAESKTDACLVRYQWEQSVSILK